MKAADLVADRRTNALAALAQGWRYHVHRRHGEPANYWTGKGIVIDVVKYAPSSTRAQWAELHEMFNVNTSWQIDNTWSAVILLGDIRHNAPFLPMCGPTLGLAICKAVIAAKWGDEIPDEIWEKVK